MHVVAVSDDGDYLLLATRADATRGSVRVPIDDRLRDAARGALVTPQQAGAQSRLTPKDMQARLRAGESPAQVARIAGVPVSRVEPYAAPVLAERSRVIDQARAATMVRARQGRSVVPLGEAVDTHLASTPYLKPDSVDWSARRSDDGSWIVVLSFVARGRRKVAEWTWVAADRSARPLGRLATTLGFVGPARANRRAADKRSSGSAAAHRAPRRRAAPSAAKGTTSSAPAKATPAARRRQATTEAATKSPRSTTGRARARKATQPAAARSRATRKGAAGGATSRGATPRKAAPRSSKAAPRSSTAPKPTPSYPPPARSEQNGQPSKNGHPSGNGRRPSRRERPTVPSWSDVLLGVQDAAERD
jgi:hypothetical protein